MKAFFLMIVCIFVISISSSFAADENDITVTILYDNYAYVDGTKTDWGFACLIEGTEKKILFDTGTKSDVLFHNIDKLKVNIKDVELVIISHNHGDHTGGLSRFLQENHNVSVYMPYSTPKQSIQKIEKTGAKVLQEKESTKICEDVYLTGEMGVQIAEQAIIFDTKKGLIVLTGCAHPGIVEIVEKAKNIMNKEIYLVFGGFHLMAHSEDQVNKIIKQFKNLGVKKAGATHCTGDNSIELFKKGYGKDYVQMGVGRVLKF